MMNNITLNFFNKNLERHFKTLTYSGFRKRVFFISHLVAIVLLSYWQISDILLELNMKRICARSAALFYVVISFFLAGRQKSYLGSMSFLTNVIITIFSVEEVRNTWSHSAIFLNAWISAMYQSSSIPRSNWLPYALSFLFSMFYLPIRLMCEGEVNITMIYYIMITLLFLYFNYIDARAYKMSFSSERKLIENMEMWRHFVLEVNQGVTLVLKESSSSSRAKQSRDKFKDPCDFEILKKNERAENEFAITNLQDFRSLLKKIRLEKFGDIYQPREPGRTIFSTVDQPSLEELINKIFQQQITFFSQYLVNAKKDIFIINLKGYLKQDIFHSLRELKVRITLCFFCWNDEPVVVFQLEDINIEDEISSLKKLDKFKDQLLANVTHDLRTPLNGVIFMIDLAKPCVEERERETYLEFAKINANLLLNLINDILDYSQIKNGKINLQLAKFKLSQLIEQVVSLMRIQADSKGIKLYSAFNSCPENDLTLYSDERRLKQILINLLSNAIKFTMKGFVQLTVTYIQNQALVKFEVLDSGVGIKKDIIPKLTQPFATFDNEEGMNKQGIGLGLSICKKLAGFLGPYEELFIASEIGRGSKFGILCDLEYTEAVDNPKGVVSRTHIEDPNERNRLSSSKNEARAPFSSYFSTIQEELLEIDMEDVHALEINDNAFYNNSPRPLFFRHLYEKNNSSNLSSNFSDLRVSERRNEKAATELHASPKKDRVLEENLQESSRSKINKEKSLVSESTIEKKILPRGSHVSILIVDDNAFNIMILKSLVQKVEKIEFAIATASNGLEALSRFQQNNQPSSSTPFSLIFMDCQMPIMDGYEASLKIKELVTQKRYIPATIIAFTSYSGPEEKDKCLEAGMDDYVVKPASESDIRNIIMLWC